MRRHSGRTIHGRGKWDISVATDHSNQVSRQREEVRNSAEWAPRPQVDTAMVKALARAFRWRSMLDEGEVATPRELAQREKVAFSYVAHGLQLNCLAPDIVEAILEGRQPVEMDLDHLLLAFSLDWKEQRVRFC